MNYKLLLIASLLFVATIVKAEEEEDVEIPSDIDEISSELKEVFPDEDEDEIKLADRDDYEQVKQQKWWRRRRRRWVYYAKNRPEAVKAQKWWRRRRRRWSYYGKNRPEVA